MWVCRVSCPWVGTRVQVNAHLRQGRYGHEPTGWQHARYSACLSYRIGERERAVCVRLCVAVYLYGVETSSCVFTPTTHVSVPSVERQSRYDTVANRMGRRRHFHVGYSPNGLCGFLGTALSASRGPRLPPALLPRRLWAPLSPITRYSIRSAHVRRIPT